MVGVCVRACVVWQDDHQNIRKIHINTAELNQLAKRQRPPLDDSGTTEMGMKCKTKRNLGMDDFGDENGMSASEQNSAARAKMDRERCPCVYILCYSLTFRAEWAK